MIKKHRAILYIDEEQYRLFRSALALAGMTVSGWFREKVDEFIKEQGEKVSH